MRFEEKLARSRGTEPRSHVQGVLGSMKRILSRKIDRHAERPLRDIDGWSTQSEVAYYEQGHARGA